LIHVENSLFAEHIDVVHSQLAAGHSTSDVRQLDIDDVTGRRLRRAVSATSSFDLRHGGAAVHGSPKSQALPNYRSR